MSKYFPGRIKIYYRDLEASGYVTNRNDLKEKIKAGRIRPPRKEGNFQQSRAFWLASELDEDIDRELEKFAAA